MISPRDLITAEERNKQEKRSFVVVLMQVMETKGA